MTRLLLPLATALLASGAGAQLLPRERTAIDDALTLAGGTAGSTTALRPPFVARHPLARTLAADPFGEGLETVLALAERAVAEPDALLGMLRPTPAGGAAFATPPVAPESLPADLAPALRAPMVRLIGAVARANAQIREALRALKPEERRALIEGLPGWAGRRAGLRPEFAKTPYPGGRAAESALRALLARVNLALLRQAGEELDAEIAETLPALRAAVGGGPPARLRFLAAGVTVELTGAGDDVHTARDAGLVVDLGGRNRYSGRAGAGIGYAGVLIDLGAAEFDAPDAGPGCGLLGVGIARIEGAATGRAGLLAFGAGVAGVGVFRAGGQASLECRAMGQGFGLAGTGVMTLGKGRDALTLGTLGQGCGLEGGEGVLVDAGGDDRYECRGLAPDELGGARESCAQGYGEGGFGLLADANGDDLYQLGARGQGAGTDGGLGILLDVEGDDLRHAARFAQGYGADGAGLLMDAAGDDLDVTFGGEAHGSAGAGGLGVMLDRAGDDTVVGGGAGLAASEGIALFLDGGGEDALSVRTRPEEIGGVGLFVSLGTGLRGADLPTPGTTRPGPEGTVVTAPGTAPIAPGLEPVAPGSLPANPERIARAVGLLVSRRGGLRAGAVRELTAYGRPGLDAAVERLEDLDDEAIDALAEIVVALGELGRRAIAPRLENPSASALRLAARARVPVATGALLAALDDDRRDAALETIAAVGDPALAPAVLPLVVSEEPGVPRRAMRALLHVGGATEEGSVRSLVTTPDPVLRLMVQSFVARFPDALAFARGLSQDPDANRAGAGIAILGLIGGDEALRIAGTGLNSPTRSLRLAALRALAGRVPEGWRARILELQTDSDSLVASAARGIELGR